MDKFDWLIRKILASSNLPDYVNHCHYPLLHVDVDRVLAEKIKGIQIESITLRDLQFRVTTREA
jgi:hypothetical protein